jgi:hypothetical protein
VAVTDNRDDSESNRYYEIVPGGLEEDALARVDRTHQWNGVTPEGMPAYLIHADYVRTFAEDRTRRDREIKVELGRPADLYVFFDKRIAPPAWLTQDFKDTGDMIGMDVDRWGKNRKRVVGVGPGVSINARFSVWKRTVNEPGSITLGPPYGTRKNSGGMYGIAAVPLESGEKTPDSK